MKYLIKKYWILFLTVSLISIPLLILGTIRTNYSITLTGDTTSVSSLITVEPGSDVSGDISTIYVTSVDHSTILHNLLANMVKSSTINEMSEVSLHLTDSETYQANRIMYNSARNTSLIAGYKKAKEYNNNLNLVYSYSGVSVTFYRVSSTLRIGDIIYKLYDNETNNTIDTTNYDNFIYALNNYQSIGDILYYTRDGINYELTLDEDNIRSFSGYSIYSIDFNSSNFNVSYKYTNTGGPSGGLLQAIAIFNQLTEIDYTYGLNIAGTGTINENGVAGVIGGIRQKIYTAFENNVDVFFCPSENYSDALEAYNEISNKERMKLVCVTNIDEAIDYLINNH